MQLDFITKDKLKTTLLNNIDIILFLIIVPYKLICFGKQISPGYFTYKALLLPVLSSVFIFLSIPLLFKNKHRSRLLYAFNIIISSIIIADIIYFRYFKDVISIGVIRNGLLLGGVKSSVQALVKPLDFVYLLDVFVIIPFMKIYKKRERNQLVFRKRFVLFIAIFIAGISLNAKCIYKLSKEQPKLITTMYNRLYVANYLGDVDFHILDTYSYISNNIKKGIKLSSERETEIKSYLTNNSKPKGTYLNNVGKGKNLIIIQVEALQQFTINSKINGQEVTPNLNRWITKSRYYDNYFYQVGAGNTSDAEFMTNNSLYPAASGAAYYNYCGNYFDSLPSLLSAKGYETSVFHAYKQGFWNRNVMYKAEKFGTFNSEDSYNLDEKVGLGLSDKSFFNQTLEKLKNLKSPYYAFLITLSSHYPYDDTAHYGEFNVGKYEGTFFGDYLKAIHYADAQLGMFLDNLDKEGIMNNSIVVLYGDHYAIPKSESASLYDFTNTTTNDDLSWLELQKIPFLIHFPQDANKGIDHTYNGQMNLMPTLSNLYDLNAKYTFGKDFFNDMAPNIVLRNGSFTDGKVFYMAPTDTFYDIATKQRVAETEELKKKKDKALNELNYSDDLLNHNLIKKFDGK